MLILGAALLAFFSYTQQLSNLGVRWNEEGKPAENEREPKRARSNKQASRGGGHPFNQITPRMQESLSKTHPYAICSAEIGTTGFGDARAQRRGLPEVEGRSGDAGNFASGDEDAIRDDEPVCLQLQEMVRDVLRVMVRIKVPFRNALIINR